MVAGHAGRVGEAGVDALWIAPELVDTQAVATQCSRPVTQTRELVFEILDQAEIEQLPRHLSVGAREVVDFTWNPDTSELSYSTTTTSPVFSDLAANSVATDPTHRTCESR
jgi:hypothetical protein